MSAYKITETETHIFFLTGPLSQWHPAMFFANFKTGEDKHLFNCAEQYMMAAKAKQFEDEDTFDKIMKASHPREQKQLGRAVKNFIPAIWDSQAEDIVFRGNYFRAVQNQEYRDVLISSGEKFLVEGNKDDGIWGVALHWDDPAILDSDNWNGKNLLGKVHMKVRTKVNEQMDFGWQV
jgi:ribA/ribD-fused uncharacterized protein